MSEIFTHALHFEDFVTVIEMFPTVSQFPQNGKKEAEDAFTRMRQIECNANILGFLNLNINPRDPFKTSWISRHVKYITFMIKDKIL